MYQTITIQKSTPILFPSYPSRTSFGTSSLRARPYGPKKEGSRYIQKPCPQAGARQKGGMSKSERFYCIFLSFFSFTTKFGNQLLPLQPQLIAAEIAARRNLGLAKRGCLFCLLGCPKRASFFSAFSDGKDTYSGMNGYKQTLWVCLRIATFVHQKQ